MASICKQILIDAPAAHAWDAVRDVGALHERLVPGFVVDTTLEGDERVVTFANGLVARELIVDIDDDAQRLAYAVVGGLFVHHHASAVVEPTGPSTSRITWTADLLPNDRAGAIDAMMDAGAAAMQLSLASAPARR